jgi:hypothetical protein
MEVARVGYQRFKAAEFGFGPATVANPATVGLISSSSVAGLASVAGHEPDSGPLEARSVATVAAPIDESGWSADFVRLNPDCSPASFSGRHWREIIRDGSLFLSTWAIQAHDLGWTALDLFGAHRIAPEARWDCAGLVLLIGGGRVVAMTDASATIQRPSGSRLTYSRTPAHPEAVALWELAGK